MNASGNATPLVSVVIASHNGKALLETCLPAIFDQKAVSPEVIVVDQGSSDGTAEWMAREYPSVRIILLPENRGFAGPNNLGFAQATGKYIVTLNNDAVLQPGCLKAMTDAAGKDERIGMVAAVILLQDEPGCLDSAGLGLCRDGMSKQWRHGAPAAEAETVGGILFPSACCALYRKSMLDEIGFFDEEFYAFCEDSDLGLRARLAGWGAVLARDARVIHGYSRSFGAVSATKLYYVERNHIWTAVKNLPLPWLLMLPMTTAYRLALMAMSVLTGGGYAPSLKEPRSRMAAALWRAYVDAVRGLPRMWAKRAKLHALRRREGDVFGRLASRFHIPFWDLAMKSEASRREPAPSRRPRKIGFVCSGGGHLTEALVLSEEFGDADCFFMTYEGEVEKLPVRLYPLPRSLQFPHRFLYGLIRVARILLKERPDALISTGSEVALLAFPTAKLMGIKLIYVECGAQVYQPSLTGRILHRLCDQFFVQWPQLLRAYPKSMCKGAFVE